MAYLPELGEGAANITMGSQKDIDDAFRSPSPFRFMPGPTVTKSNQDDNPPTKKRGRGYPPKKAHRLESSPSPPRQKKKTKRLQSSSEGSGEADASLPDTCIIEFTKLD